MPFRPLDLPYHDEGNLQTECSQCIEHRAKPERKIIEHKDKYLDAYIEEVEKRQDAQLRLDRAQNAIKPIAAAASRRYDVLDKIDELLSKKPDEDDEDSANSLLDHVYRLLGDWRSDERRHRPR